jgi:hypothetical protein
MKITHELINGINHVIGIIDASAFLYAHLLANKHNGIETK